MPRKIIALLTALPESVHGQRIVKGIMAQCRKYGYHLAVFGSMTHLQLEPARARYTIGEMNIFQLTSYGTVDGIILDASTLYGDPTGENIKKICARIEQECKAPVVALEMPIGDYHLVQNRNEEILREMCRHVIEVHGKKKICILTGQKDNPVAESRLAVFLDEIGKHGLTVAPEHIIYGDFWYFSGDTLAEKLLSGQIPMLEAVLCASDHMAIGLIDRLHKNGVKIPEDLIVIGMEATEEGATNQVPLSSYEANDANSAADAVDYIRSIIEPDAEIIPYEANPEDMFHPAKSCGCEPDYLRSAKAFQSALYHTSRNYEGDSLLSNIDIGVLMESYVLEQLTATETPEECIANIHSCTYLLLPYVNCYLCLREDWLDTDCDTVEGYPEQMLLVSASTTVGELAFSDPKDSILFDTKRMIPKLWEESAEAYVFYFAPLHFNENTLGYCVLQRRLDDPHCINLVFRNWLRFVGNALELSRAKKRLTAISVRDEMTGAFNRRGMHAELERMLRNAPENNTVFVGVIDMDGLKYINDTFGHHEGDFAIRVVSTAVASVTAENEIYVRAGGDEFYIIGVGIYDADAAEQRTGALCRILEAMTHTYEKPYTVTASIGCAMHAVDNTLNINELICEADEIMYKYKVTRKRQRQ